MYFKAPEKTISSSYLKTYNIFRLGDIAFEGNKSKHFKNGRFVENTIGDGIVSHVFEVLRPTSNYDIWFWKYLINNEAIMSDVLSRSTKSTIMMKNLIVSDFLKETVCIPSLPEQNKIGRLLKQIDSLITLQQRKLDGLKELKKGCLQKLFPKNSSLFPEVRFPGFTEPWEQRELGKIGKTYGGLTGKTKEDFGHGKANFLTYLNIFQNPIADEKDLGLIELDDKQNKVLKGDILFTISSETPEEVGMSSVWLGNVDNLYLNSFCFGYRLSQSQKFNPYFFAYLMRSEEIRKKIILLAQGISRYNISKNKVMELVISVPSLEEQEKIGNTLKTVDSLITLQQRKIETMKNLKKYLLQNMFV